MTRSEIDCGGPHPCLDRLITAEGSNRTLPPGRILRAEGEPIDHVIRVERGTLRSCLYTDGGDRQVIRFAGPGSVLGLLDPERWRTTLETVDCVQIRSVPKGRVERELQRSAPLREEVRRLMACRIAEREAHLVALAYLPARERVRRFLEARAAERPGARFSTLPMSRKDIGDHLGLSIETVSRAFTALRRDGLLELRGPNMFRMLEAGGEGVRDAA